MNRWKKSMNSWNSPLYPIRRRPRRSILWRMVQLSMAKRRQAMAPRTNINRHWKAIRGTCVGFHLTERATQEKERERKRRKIGDEAEAENKILTEQGAVRRQSISKSTFFLLFNLRKMSGLRLASSVSLRQLASFTTPKDLCDYLGGDRVINKVKTSTIVFMGKTLSSFLSRFSLLTTASLQWNACVRFDDGPTKCFDKRMPSNSSLW